MGRKPRRALSELGQERRVSRADQIGPEAVADHDDDTVHCWGSLIRPLVIVIPGCPMGAGPESTNTNLARSPRVRVHRFRDRGRRPRPGMTDHRAYASLPLCSSFTSTRIAGEDAFAQLAR